MSKDLSLLQQILLATDGTVTDLIALYANEPMRVTKLSQEVRTTQAPAELMCDGNVRLLNRRILLSGVNRNYLYAESLFVFDRFSAATQARLFATDMPIGLLWKDERLETYRETVRKSIEPCADIAAYFGLTKTDEFVSRTYLIHHGGKPLGAITEKWPVTFFRD